MLCFFFFKKEIKAILIKIRSMWYIDIVLLLLFLLTLASDSADLYGNSAFSILVLLTIGRYSSIFKKFLFFWKLVSDLYGNSAFSILVLSTIKRYSSILKKFLFFRKLASNLFQVLKTSKISSDCQIKHSDFSNGGLFWESLVLFFRGSYTLSLGFKMKPIRETVFLP